MQTAIIGEADTICANDADFFDKMTIDYLNGLNISVLKDTSLMHRLRTIEGTRK